LQILSKLLKVVLLHILVVWIINRLRLVLLHLELLNCHLHHCHYKVCLGLHDGPIHVLLVVELDAELVVVGRNRLIYALNHREVVASRTVVLVPVVQNIVYEVDLQETRLVSLRVEHRKDEEREEVAILEHVRNVDVLGGHRPESDPVEVFLALGVVGQDLERINFAQYFLQYEFVFIKRNR